MSKLIPDLTKVPYTAMSQNLNRYRQDLEETGLFTEISSGKAFSFLNLTGTNFVLKISMIGKRRWVVKLHGLHSMPEMDIKFEDVFERSPDEIKEKLIFHMDLFR